MFIMANIPMVLLFVTVLSRSSCAGVVTEVEGQSHGDEKVPLLAVVSFPPEECTVRHGHGGAMTSNGVCYSKEECCKKGGVDLGDSCGHGDGICCGLSQSCPVGGESVTVNNNLTTITSTMQSCNFVISKQPDVCQVRLDFVQFQVGDYNYSRVSDEIKDFGRCVHDKMVISPSQNLPEGMVICGAATGQHLYLHYGDQNKITLSLTQTMLGTFAIKVTMIKCHSVLKAPEGCTQYHREKAGRVESFNFPNMQLNSHRYSVCIRGEGERQVEWSSCWLSPQFSMSTTFFVSGQTPPVPQMTGTQNCVTDYVLLPGSEHERYCGGNFTTAQSRVIPFTMWVNFDESETPKELFPGSRIDPTTGCPLGFTCSLKSPEICSENPDPIVAGTCSPPPGYAELQDNYNFGFCLDYNIGSTYY